MNLVLRKVHPRSSFEYAFSLKDWSSLMQGLVPSCCGWLGRSLGDAGRRTRAGPPNDLWWHPNR